MSDSSPPTGKRADFERQAVVHLNAVYSTAMRLTRNPRDAEDLTQDAMLRAFRFWDNYEPGTNCRAWLLKILTNLYFNEFRKAARQREIHHAAGIEQAATQQVLIDADRPSHQSPEQALLAGTLSDGVAAALASLPAEFRAAIALCDMQGLSYQETADALGCPVGTVMSRLFRGRRLLRAALAGQGSGAQATSGGATKTSRGVVDLAAYREQAQKKKAAP